VFRDSNILTFRTLDAEVRGRHALQVFAGYGHQDVFMGKNVAAEVFPAFLRFLEQQRRAGGTWARSRTAS
jgi:cholesterol oxidase